MRCSTFCEQTMRAVCAELDVELIECNGEADYVHLVVAYLSTLAISALVPSYFAVPC
jgi:putative transposase